MRSPALQKRILAVLVGAALAVPAMADPASAHGIGGRTDLPLPAWQMTWAAGFAVASSFVALGAFWGKPLLEAAADGRELPSWMQPRAWTFAITKVLGVAMFGVILYAAWFGNDTATVNISGDAVYIIFWVGMQIISAVVGDVWSAFNPFITIADSAAWLKSKVVGKVSDDPANAEVTVWPAVAAIGSFAWMELAYHSSGEPRSVAIYLTAYSVAMLGGAAYYGRGFVRRADGFGMLMTIISSVAPLYRDASGRLRLRIPLAGVSKLPVVPGTVGFILVVLGTTTFDGFTRSSTWGRVSGASTGWALTFINTIGMVLVIGLVALAFLGGIRAMSNITGDSELELSDVFGPTLVTIMVAYTVAHYFSLLVLDGQRFIIQISDPFGRGWDLFGTKDYAINWALVSTGVIAWVQTTAIAAGHVLAVAASHDRAIDRYERTTALRSQYSMLAVMITYTVVGLIILLGAF